MSGKRKRRSSSSSYSVTVSSTVESLNGTVPYEEFGPVECIEILLIAYQNSSGEELSDINTAVVLTIDYPYTLESVFTAEEVSTTTVTTTTTTEAGDEFIAELVAQVQLSEPESFNCRQF
jgi:hypothetical protein